MVLNDLCRVTNNSTTMKKTTNFNVAVLGFMGALLFFAQGCGKDDAPDLGLPVLTTLPVSEITSNSAKGGGNIFSDGGSPITSRGLCWSKSPNPTIENSTSSDGTGTGAFESEISSLEDGITYYVRAYAINNVGVAYGQQEEFTTKKGVDIYLVGSINLDGKEHPVVLKNQDVSIFSNYEGYFWRVYVRNGDIHLTGYDRTNEKQRYWKNGVIQYDVTGAYPGVNSIYVDADNSVYFAGIQMHEINFPIFQYQATVWKNGILNSLTSFDVAESFGNDMKVVGNDVYVVGHVRLNSDDKPSATIWKNGVETYLTDGSKHAMAYSIDVVNGDVYVGGFEGESVFSPEGKYWKNGVPFVLGNGLRVTSIKAIGNDLYAAGYDSNDNSMYWKNGIGQLVVPGETMRFHVDSSHNVYMLVDDHDGKSQFYKNGTKISINHEQGEFYFYDFFFVEK
jgi:hypothetical protein